MLVWTQENIWNQVWLERGTNLFIVRTGLNQVSSLPWTSRNANTMTLKERIPDLMAAKHLYKFLYFTLATAGQISWN